MVHIVSDSTACLPPEIVTRYKVTVIPQIINFDGNSYREGVDIDTSAFIRKLETHKELPRTAAPPPQFFIETFRRLASNGETIICIHPSSQVSGTVRSAQLAAAEYPRADIRIIDTRTIALALGKIVICAARLAEQNSDVNSICQQVNDLASRARIYFRVATLEYLVRGGRIGRAAALLGSVLRIKPILTMRNGMIDQLARERTEARAIARMTRILTEECPGGDAGEPAMMCDGTPQQRAESAALAERFGAVLGRAPLEVSTIPPAIITHTGPGVIGVGFFTRE